MNLFQSDDIVWAIIRTVAAVDADLRLMLRIVPEDCAKGAGLDAVVAADAEIGFEAHATAFTRRQCVGGTDAGARRIGAGATDDDDEAFADAARRVDVDARILQPAAAGPPRAGEHTRLAADTAVNVDDG